MGETVSETPCFRTILHALNSHACHTGDDVAFTFLDSNESTKVISYRELQSQSQRVASALLRRASPADRALIACPSSIEYVIAFLGCLYAGIIAVPAFPPHRNRKSERLDSILENCAPSLILTFGDGTDRFEEIHHSSRENPPDVCQNR